jgi:trehalose/maltose hydrolase-like predicted phosphorylase
VSDWVLTFDGFDPATERLREALCVLGNGYFATRGAAPECGESPGVHYPGTYAAGCYNRLTSHVDGQVIENESLVNTPNWLPLTFRIGEGEWFAPEAVELLEYQQELDMRRGVLTRRMRFRDGHGRETRLVQRRFVHMGERHVAGLETTLVAENWSGRVEFLSAIDGRVTNGGVDR